MKDLRGSGVLGIKCISYFVENKREETLEMIKVNKSLFKSPLFQLIQNKNKKNQGIIDKKKENLNPKLK